MTACKTVSEGFHEISSEHLLQLECPAGKYGFNRSHCELCPIGWYQSAAKQSACVEAVDGKYISTEGATVPLQCSAGRFWFNASSCKQCPLGFFKMRSAARHASAVMRKGYE